MDYVSPKFRCGKKLEEEAEEEAAATIKTESAEEKLRRRLQLNQKPSTRLFEICIYHFGQILNFRQLEDNKRRRAYRTLPLDSAVSAVNVPQKTSKIKRLERYVGLVVQGDTLKLYSKEAKECWENEEPRVRQFFKILAELARIVCLSTTIYHVISNE